MCFTKKNTTNDRVEILLYPCLVCKKEIGHLIIRVYSADDVIQSRIDAFYVEPKYRNQGYGKKMFKQAIAELKKLKCYRLIVYPHPEPKEFEKALPYSTLYNIYEKLGFHFTNDKFDYNKPNEEMVYVFH